MPSKHKPLRGQRWGDYGILLLISLLTMLICTKSSPLYPLNDWVDSNAIFTVGKSILHGKVIYRDLFDHKGPILHFIHALGALISFKTFFGVWLLQVVACFFFLLCSYRTLLLFTDRRAIIVMPVYAVIVYCSRSLCQGDSAEEFCLPLVMYAIYVIVKSLKEQKPISRKELFCVGITSAVILWIKYTMLGLYIGWILLPFILAVREKKWTYIRDIFLFVMAGVLLVSLAVISYFLANGAVGDLFYTYFYSNMTQYQSGQPMSLGFILIIIYAIYQNLPVWLCFLVGCIWLLIKRRWLITIQLLLTAGVGLLFTYFRFTVYSLTYYAFIFSGFSLFGFIAFYSMAKKLVSKLKPGVYACILGLCCLLILPSCYLLSSNSSSLLVPKEELPQYQFAEIINQNPNATVLNYNAMDMGVYTVTGIVPEYRYFCAMNLDAPKISKEQYNLVEAGAVDFIVTKETPLTTELYELRKTVTYPSGSRGHEYYLYERKAEN